MAALITILLKPSLIGGLFSAETSSGYNEGYLKFIKIFFLNQSSAIRWAA